MKRKNNLFLKGLTDGLPIGLGYLSVSVGVGIMAGSCGLSALCALIISMTNLTSAGETAGIALIAVGGGFLEMALIQAVINLRYSLMGISLSQRLDSSFSLPHRIFLSFFITDEIFGVSSRRDILNIRYMYGLIILPYIGWTVGTFIGASAGMILPETINRALSLAIYGMFIAIFLPSAKKSKGVCTAVVIASALSCIIRFVPLFSFISYGFTIIIASVFASAIAAFISVGRNEK